MKIRALVFCLLLVTASGAQAATKEQEISHLLEFIETSECEFDRNGSIHSPLEAREHIAMKYDYVKKRISSTEDFIEYAATRSSMTGSLYHVVCSGERIPSGAWLNQELARYRSTGSE